MRQHHGPMRKLKPGMPAGNVESVLDVLHGVMPLKGHQPKPDTDALRQGTEEPTRQGSFEFGLADK